MHNWGDLADYRVIGLKVAHHKSTYQNNGVIIACVILYTLYLQQLHKEFSRIPFYIRDERPIQYYAISGHNEHSWLFDHGFACLI